LPAPAGVCVFERRREGETPEQTLRLSALKRRDRKPSDVIFTKNFREKRVKSGIIEKQVYKRRKISPPSFSVSGSVGLPLYFEQTAAI
jgi:hypothetical protein